MKPQASRRDLRRDAMSILAAGTLAPEQRDRLIAALAAYAASAACSPPRWQRRNCISYRYHQGKHPYDPARHAAATERRRAYAILAKIMRQTPGTAQSAAYRRYLTDMLVPGRTLHCAMCGKAFEATRRDALTCSVRCRRLKAKRGALDPALRDLGLA